MTNDIRKKAITDKPRANIGNVTVFSYLCYEQYLYHHNNVETIHQFPTIKTKSQAK